MSGGICLWTKTRLGKWNTTCGGRNIPEPPRDGKACPWCGMKVVSRMSPRNDRRADRAAAVARWRWWRRHLKARALARLQERD